MKGIPRDMTMEKCQGTCGQSYPWLNEGADSVRRCPECDAAARESARRRAVGGRLHAQLDSCVRAQLEGAGMSPRELVADANKIPGAISAMLSPDPDVEKLRTGFVPEHGFGLSGMAGHGKTCAIAAYLREGVRARLDRELPHKGEEAMRRWALWLAWPETVSKLRVLSTRDGGLQRAEEIIEEACEAPVLVIDDLGAERMRGSYSEDWVASQLDLVVDSRYRNFRPTWYTTTLNHDRLLNQYGQRLYSRLISANPLHVVPAEKDLRTWGMP